LILTYCISLSLEIYISLFTMKSYFLFFLLVLAIMRAEAVITPDAADSHSSSSPASSYWSWFFGSSSTEATEASSPAPAPVPMVEEPVTSVAAATSSDSGKNNDTFPSMEDDDDEEDEDAYVTQCVEKAYILEDLVHDVVQHTCDTKPSMIMDTLEGMSYDDLLQRLKLIVNKIAEKTATMATATALVKGELDHDHHHDNGVRNENMSVDPASANFNPWEGLIEIRVDWYKFYLLKRTLLLRFNNFTKPLNEWKELHLKEFEFLGYSSSQDLEGSTLVLLLIAIVCVSLSCGMVCYILRSHYAAPATSGGEGETIDLTVDDAIDLTVDDEDEEVECAAAPQDTTDEDTLNEDRDGHLPGEAEAGLDTEEGSINSGTPKDVDKALEKSEEKPEEKKPVILPSPRAASASQNSAESSNIYSSGTSKVVFVPKPRLNGSVYCDTVLIAGDVPHAKEEAKQEPEGEKRTSEPVATTTAAASILPSNGTDNSPASVIDERPTDAPRTLRDIKSKKQEKRPAESFATRAALILPSKVTAIRSFVATAPTAAGQDTSDGISSKKPVINPYLKKPFSFPSSSSNNGNPFSALVERFGKGARANASPAAAATPTENQHPTTKPAATNTAATTSVPKPPAEEGPAPAHPNAVNQDNDEAVGSGKVETGPSKDAPCTEEFTTGIATAVAERSAVRATRDDAEDVAANIYVHPESAEDFDTSGQTSKKRSFGLFLKSVRGSFVAKKADESASPSANKKRKLSPSC